MFPVIAGTAIACCETVYAARLFRLRREVARSLYLPPESHLSWTADPWQGSIPLEQAPGHGLPGAMDDSVAQLACESDEQTRRNELVRRQSLTGLALVGSGIDAIFANLSNMEHLLDINWDVIRALDFSYAADLSHFDALHAVVHEGLNQDPEQVAGWLSRLHGYVAEQVAADALSAQGYHVSFPDVPNEARYDLIVDGLPMQVKAGLDPQAIHEHLQAHPDIPVLTSPEIAEHFHDVLEVSGLPELDYDAVHDTTVDTLHAVDSMHSGGIHIPMVTAIISGIREIGLLAQNMTDFPTSLKNMGLNMLGTGAGGAIGAKVGAAVGGVLGPVGFAIGGLLGGIAGAMIGRGITNEIKLASFRKPYENLVAAVERVKATIDRSQEETRQKLAAAAEEAQRRLEQGLAAIHESCQRELNASRDSLLSQVEAFSRDFPDVLRQVRALLVETRNEVLARLPHCNLFTRYMWPTYAGVAHRVVANWFRWRLAFLDRAVVELERLAMDSRLSPQEKLARIRQFVLDHPALYDDLERLATDLSAEYERAVSESRDVVRRSEDQARNLQDNLKQELQRRASRL
ncbi:MAG: hypothetical protein AB1700_03165, partial [Bacillota bacterium]